MTWLSILMPTYNGARYLPATLASLERQDLSGVELLVVDDGSQDETLALLRDFRGCPASILPGPQQKNWVASTNVALGAARGEFACLLHQDDGMLADRLTALRAVTERYPGAAVWTHWAQYMDERDRPLGLWSAPLGRKATPLSNQVVLEHLLVQNFYAIPSPLFRVRDARAVGGLDEALWYTADWDFWLKLSRLGDTVCLPKALSWFRVHNESQTVRRSTDAASFREQHTRVFERHFPHLTGSPQTRRAVQCAASMSIEINVALSSALHGAGVDAKALWRTLRALNFDSTARLMRDTRLHERILSRLRAGVSART